MPSALQRLGSRLVLAELMEVLHASFGGFELLDHWLQGEFHHDLVFACDHADLAPFLVVSTNCNGGVKEILGLEERPRRWALWNHRCPDNPEFEGDLGVVVARVRTVHWFDPCALLTEDARSELRPELRVRARGGGWKKID